MLDIVADFSSNYAEWSYLLAIASLAFLLLSILFIPFIISRIPADYFMAPRRSLSTERLSLQRILLKVIRNTIGVLLILAGIIMLVLPGQGILTILAGLFILDFHGKYKFERYLVRKQIILKSLNWIRRRQNIPEIRIY